MAKRKRDPLREDRIENEVIVDAYGPEEQTMGWHRYLEGKIRFRSRPSVSRPRWFRPSSKEKPSKSEVWPPLTPLPERVLLSA